MRISIYLLLIFPFSGCLYLNESRNDSKQNDCSDLTRIVAVVNEYLQDGYWNYFGGGTSDLAVLTIVDPDSYKNRIEICIFREQRKSVSVLRDKGTYVQFYMSNHLLEINNNPVSIELFGPFGVERLKGLEKIDWKDD